MTRIFNVGDTKDEDPLADAEKGSVFGFKWTWGNELHGFDEMSYIAMDCTGACFEVEDPSGNKMLVEDYFQNYLTLIEDGHADALAVGDTFDSILGYINSYYGSYKTDEGGQYRIQPTSLGLVGRNSGKSCPPKTGMFAREEMDGGLVAGMIILGIFISAGVGYGVYKVNSDASKKAMEAHQEMSHI